MARQIGNQGRVWGAGVSASIHFIRRGCACPFVPAFGPGLRKSETRLEPCSLAPRAGRSDVGGHRLRKTFDLAAGGAAPAHAAWFFARLQPRNDRVEPVSHLLERLTQRDNELIVGHRTNGCGPLDAGGWRAGRL